jgi:hypothetical protein
MGGKDLLWAVIVGDGNGTRDLAVVDTRTAVWD